MGLAKLAGGVVQMKMMLLIGIAAVAAACSSEPRNHDLPAPGGGAASGGAASSTPGAANQRAGNRAVTLVGCLRGPAPSGETTGTSGTGGARAGAAGGVTPDASNARFTLADATAPAEGAGVGANGAGGSGGPLVSGTSSYDLDAVAADAAAHVNKQVRVTGQIDPNPVGTATGAAAASGNRRIMVSTIQVVSDTCPRP
jgi:hypothetical protein